MDICRERKGGEGEHQPKKKGVAPIKKPTWGLQEMNKSYREIIMGFSIFHLPREGQPAKQTPNFK